MVAKALSFILAALLLAPTAFAATPKASAPKTSAPAAAAQKPAAQNPGVQAAAWVLEIDGAEVTSGNVDKRQAPASLTKMMTALLALERGGLEDMVKISKAASEETGHRLGLKAGDELRVADLAAAAIIASANDAARALAEHIAGSEAEFSKLMNERAKKLGMTGTRFENASGHDSPAHYSTARDLAILGKEAMRNPWYAGLASRVALEIRTKAGRVFKLENKNELVGRYEGAIGVKSGTTPKAGKSLVAMAERGGRKAFLVLLGAKERWFQSEALLDRAFAAAPTPPPENAPR